MFVVPWIACASPPPAAVAHDPVCGNGIVEGKEECDDGNQDNGDGCLTTCLKPLAWASAEPHVHGHGCSGQRGPSSLVQLLEEQSFDIGSALVWGHGYQTDSAYFTGKDSSDSTPGHILHYDLETSAMGPSKTGHLVLLGLKSLAYSNDIFYTPQSGVPVVDWARSQGDAVAVGMAHGQFWNKNDDFPSFPVPNCCLPPDDCCVPWELPVHTARGRLNFLITEGNGDSRGPVDTATWRIWRRLLNSGFRLTLAGGADYPCVDGTYARKTPRTRFYLDGDPTYDKWLEALRLGHVVVTLAAGDDLNLRINGARIGSEVQVAGAEAITVAIDGRFAAGDHGRDPGQRGGGGLDTGRARRPGGLDSPHAVEELLGRCAERPRPHQPGLRARRRQADPRLRERRLLLGSVHRPPRRGHEEAAAPGGQRRPRRSAPTQTRRRYSSSASTRRGARPASDDPLGPGRGGGC